MTISQSKEKRALQHTFRQDSTESWFQPQVFLSCFLSDCFGLVPWMVHVAHPCWRHLCSHKALSWAATLFLHLAVTACARCSNTTNLDDNHLLALDDRQSRTCAASAVEMVNRPRSCTRCVCLKQQSAHRRPRDRSRVSEEDRNLQGLSCSKPRPISTHRDVDRLQPTDPLEDRCNEMADLSLEWEKFTPSCARAPELAGG